jgi:thiol-disulfide isomerase/thioredoxin
MRISYACIVFTLALAAAACGGAGVASRPVPPTIEPMPALTLPLLDGGAWTTESARGSVLLVDVWASWCKPCRKGFPKLEEIAKQRPALQVVAITIDEDEAAISKFLDEVPVSFPVAHDSGQSLLHEPLSVERIPAILIVDAAGNVRHRVEEPSDRDYAELERVVDDLLAEQ